MMDKKEKNSDRSWLVLSELIFDRWTAEKRENPNQVLLLLGQKDRVIGRKQMAALERDLGGCLFQRRFFQV